MALKNLPPPPQPDPLTLDQIYENITSSDSSTETRAYNIVALQSVAFHPTVKRFLFEYHDALASRDFSPEVAASSVSSALPKEKDDSIAESNRLRREALLKNIAFLLCVRNSSVGRECRWEILSLLGELCRMEEVASSTTKSTATDSKHLPPSYCSGDSEKNSMPAGRNELHTASITGNSLQEKLNGYARANLEYLAALPWFRETIVKLLENHHKYNGSANRSSRIGASSSSNNFNGASLTAVGNSDVSEKEMRRMNIREKLQERRLQQKNKATQLEVDDWKESDEDILIVMNDLVCAMPSVSKNEKTNENTFVWSLANLEQAHDLMFLDASTSIAHLIPLVCRCYSNCCVNCLRQGALSSSSGPNGSSGDSLKDSTSNASGSGFPRCSGCKAVFYCSADCQKAHWGTAHRQPCMAYKDRKAAILAQYYALNAKKKQSKKRSQNSDEVSIVEVPIEPSLFFETRRFLYDHRDSSFEKVSFCDYFLKYTVRGN